MNKRSGMVWVPAHTKGDGTRVKAHYRKASTLKVFDRLTPVGMKHQTGKAIISGMMPRSKPKMLSSKAKKTRLGILAFAAKSRQM